jgi:hypothetical protein
MNFRNLASKSETMVICARPAPRGGFLLSALVSLSWALSSLDSPRPLSPRAGVFLSVRDGSPFNQCTPLACEQLGELSRSNSQGDPVNFPISPAFEYIEMAVAWFWPAMCGMSLIVGYIAGGCAQR